MIMHISFIGFIVGVSISNAAIVIDIQLSSHHNTTINHFIYFFYNFHLIFPTYQLLLRHHLPPQKNVLHVVKISPSFLFIIA